MPLSMQECRRVIGNELFNGQLLRKVRPPIERLPAQTGSRKGWQPHRNELPYNYGMMHATLLVTEASELLTSCMVKMKR